MTKKIYTEPSLKAVAFETEDVITTSSYGTAEEAVVGGAFIIDGNQSSSVVSATFCF